jgi:protein-L-isoaspartate(D-aspartate) O-methyltransferase
MDIERARFNMIEQQIRTWNVLDQDVLEALTLIRREEFVPPAYRDMAFADVEIPLVPGGLHDGRAMFEPRVEARILQALAPRKHETALEIGTGSGFGTALLALKAREVVSYERDAAIERFASENLKRAGILNVGLHGADGSRIGGSDHFDMIVLSGSVREVPRALLERLTTGGRLFAIVGDAPSMAARLITRRTDERFEAEDLFETSTPRLAGFPDREPFRF